MSSVVKNFQMPQEAVMLTFKKDSVTGRNNVLPWLKSVINDLAKDHGDVATVLETGVAFKVPDIKVTDYTPEPLPGAAPFSAEDISHFRRHAYDAYGKAVRELEAKMTKFYYALWARISDGSRQVIQAQVDGRTAIEGKEPNLLLEVVRRTHLIGPGGANGARYLEDLETSFANLKQTTKQSVTEFKVEFDTFRKILVEAGLPDFAEGRWVIKFLDKLDPARHAKMNTDLENNKLSGGLYPATVNDAYQLASEWKCEAPRAADSKGYVGAGAAFLADDLYAFLASVKRTVPKQPVVARKPAVTGPAAPTVAGDKQVEKRKCHSCGEVGHLMRDCPRKSATALIVGDEVDEDAAYNAAMLYGSGNSNFMATDTEDAEERALFSPTVVVFDPAANRSVFHNEELLAAVGPHPNPVVLGGVQRGAPGIVIDQQGDFVDLGIVGLSSGASANILSGGEMVDTGKPFSYDPCDDAFDLQGLERKYRFSRAVRLDGTKSRFYTCDFAHVLVATVSENLRRFSVREVKQIGEAEQLMRRLGHMTSAATISLLNSGVQNCGVTATDVRNKEAAKGVSAAGLMGKSKKQQSLSPGYTLVPRVTQVQQTLHIDIIFVKKVPFLLGVLTPLCLVLLEYLRDRSEPTVAVAVETFLALAASRSFDVLEIRCDGEGAIKAMTPRLQSLGLTVVIAGSGQHVHIVERMAQTVKGRHRCHELALPFVMTLILIIWCMRFCVNCINLQASSTSTDKVCPFEQFSGIKLDAKRDLRVGFGDYVLATPPATDNSMRARVEPCIALGGKFNFTNGIWVMSLLTGKIATRNQFVINPMPDQIALSITAKAEKQGYTRGVDPTLELPPVLDDLDDTQLPDMMDIDNRPDVPPAVDVATEVAPALTENAAAAAQASTPAAGVTAEQEVGVVAPSPFEAPIPQTAPPHQLPDMAFQRFGVRWSQRLAPRAEPSVLLTHMLNDAARAEVRRQLALRAQWRDTEFAFKISVRAALRERGAEAEPVILAELQQMVDKRVWHGVMVRNLTAAERRAIIRSSMFLKDKYLASGAFEKFKARLVAGGDQQDKELYENLSSPTAATTSVLAVAAIAAAECRQVMVMDIGGAFLNADITNTGIKVHMRLDRILTQMLVQICPEFAPFVEDNGTSVVALDKALYGCVEAAALWHADLTATLMRGGFTPNPYDPCVLNKYDPSGLQITVVVHVDDLHVSSASLPSLDDFERFMRKEYLEIKVVRGRVLDYLGMTFDYRVEGQVTITMDNCVQDILSDCGVSPPRTTPAAATLFDTRPDAPKASEPEVKHFRTYVAKVLYLSKRVKPECLAAVGFLTTRVHAVDADDIAKLRRLLGYIRATQHRGIVLRIGKYMTVHAYIDAAYGVHQDSGKSHTGCAIVLGEAGVLSARSCKQKIVTKSSTEAELVGLSDSAAQAIHLRNFVQSQGYEMGPAIIYQDNLSCMALMRRGGPGSERSRHINIRHFWVAEKVADGEVVVEHLSTDLMHANALTKPVQGAQFERERYGLTNWV